MLARAVNQVDLAFIFANYALEAGIDTDKALLVEKGSDLYVEYLVARPITSTIRGFRSWRKRCTPTRFAILF
jgi:ABC-type metal ion transport system substrate-binding protein